MNNLIAFVDRLVQAGAVPALGPTGPNRRMPAGWGPHDSLEVKYDVRSCAAKGAGAGSDRSTRSTATPTSGSFSLIATPTSASSARFLLATKWTTAAASALAPTPPTWRRSRPRRTSAASMTCRCAGTATSGRLRRRTTRPDGRRNCRPCNAAKARRLRARRRLQREA